MRIRAFFLELLCLCGFAALACLHCPAQALADPLGSVQSSSIACVGKNNGGKCYQLEVSCPQLPDYTAYMKVLEPTVPVTGTTMFVTGGGTTDLLELRPFGPIVVTKLKTAGYRITELTFGSPFNTSELGWETNAGGAGVRAAACYNAALARNSREHNGANVLTLGSGQNSIEEIREIVTAFLTSELTEERHKRRVGKIDSVEKQYRK